MFLKSKKTTLFVFVNKTWIDADKGAVCGDEVYACVHAHVRARVYFLDNLCNNIASTFILNHWIIYFCLVFSFVLL